MSERAFETLCVHGKDHCYADAGRAISFPIYQTASFRHSEPGHHGSEFDYTRESNPTRSHLEEIMRDLEYALDAVAFSSGMAAITSIFDLFRPGDHILISEDLYGGVVRLIHSIAEKNGLVFDFTDTTDTAKIEAAVCPGTKAIYLETPGNPMMRVTDIRASADIAKRIGALLIVDNTFLTPCLQNPLRLGADLVVHSGSKFICGHNDTICGFVCVNSGELAERLRLISKTTGNSLSPFDSWLAMRGLKTLALRMERQQETAEKLAAWLLRQEKVRKVYYVGLESHPGYEINRKQASGAGSMISFSVDSRDTALRILKRVKLISFAESLGGTESLITYPAVQTHPDVPAEMREKLGITDRLLRLSVGIEHADDIIADLAQAFG